MIVQRMLEGEEPSLLRKGTSSPLSPALRLRWSRRPWWALKPTRESVVIDAAPPGGRWVRSAQRRRRVTGRGEGAVLAEHKSGARRDLRVREDQRGTGVPVRSTSPTG